MSSNAIPPESTVLITGVNGYIAAHVADQLLARGYKVRGTVRNAKRCKWVKKLFDKKYGKGKFELKVVRDFTVKGAFDKVVKGVSGVAHIASDLSFDTDPEKVITPSVRGTQTLLDAASRESSVKRFVYTSSAIATVFPYGDPEVITEETWNKKAKDEAWASEFVDEDRRTWAVYAQSKVEAERACWKFSKEIKQKGVGQGFELSTVLPSSCFGPWLDESQNSPTVKNIRNLLAGKLDKDREGISPYWFVDVRDTARLHVAALISPSVRSQRLFAYSEKYSWNQILDIWRRAYPDHAWMECPADTKEERTELPECRARAVEILKELGREDFIGLEESVKGNAEDFFSRAEGGEKVKRRGLWGRVETMWGKGILGPRSMSN